MQCGRAGPFATIEMIEIDRVAVCVGSAPSGQDINFILGFAFFQLNKHNLHSE
jgi:hypothetical protein